MHKFSISDDGENFGGDEFVTVGEACDRASESVRVGEVFYVGENFVPPQPAALWDAEDWLEHVSCQDEYCCDAADGWDGSTDEQQKELEREVRAVMAAWLDKHDLRPAFWMVRNVKKFRVSSIRDGQKFYEEVTGA